MKISLKPIKPAKRKGNVFGDDLDEDPAIIAPPPPPPKKLGLTAMLNESNLLEKPDNSIELEDKISFLGSSVSSKSIKPISFVSSSSSSVSKPVLKGFVRAKNAVIANPSEVKNNATEGEQKDVQKASRPLTNIERVRNALENQQNLVKDEELDSYIDSLHQQQLIDDKLKKPVENEVYPDDLNSDHEGLELFSVSATQNKHDAQPENDEDDLPKRRNQTDLQIPIHSIIPYDDFEKNMYEYPTGITAENNIQMRRELCNRIGVRIIAEEPESSAACGYPSFAHFPLPSKLRATLASNDLYKTPTPIQSQLAPLIIQGRDVIGIAKTGEGKTAAYLLPILMQINRLDSCYSSSKLKKFPKPPIDYTKSIVNFNMGKELAFPEKEELNKQIVERERGPVALVLVPTRELAIQVLKSAQFFAKPLGLVAGAIVGGVAKNVQFQMLKNRKRWREYCSKRGISYNDNEDFEYDPNDTAFEDSERVRSKRAVDIVVATPGRLIDLLLMKATHLQNVKFVVVDEADVMLDMGFEKQVRTLCESVRPDRLMVMVSATWKKKVEGLVYEVMTNPIRIATTSTLATTTTNSVNTENGQIVQHEIQEPFDERKLESNIPEHIDLHFEVVEAEMKWNWLVNNLPGLLSTYSNGSILIFVTTKEAVEALQKNMLQFLNVNCLGIHGDMAQIDRDRVMTQFRQCLDIDPLRPHIIRPKILISTNLVARGLDISHIQVVLNYDAPDTLSLFIHRAGRTGRDPSRLLNNRGTVITLLTSQEQNIAAFIAQFLEKIKRWNVRQVLKSNFPPENISLYEWNMRTSVINLAMTDTRFSKRFSTETQTESRSRGAAIPPPPTLTKNPAMLYYRKQPQ